MSGKIFVLLGKSLSGKTTVSHLLNTEYGIQRVVSFTTRPKREDEIEGIDYYFYDDSLVLLLVATGKVIALRSYQPHISFGPYPWYYGFNKNDIKIVDNPFIITDLKGLEDIINEYGKENVVSIYLDINEATQIKRMESRENLQDEQKRRIIADNKDFANAKNIADHIIDATKSPKTIAKSINNIIEKSKSRS